MSIPKENTSTNLALEILVLLQSHGNLEVNHYQYDLQYNYSEMLEPSSSSANLSRCSDSAGRPKLMHKREGQKLAYKPKSNHMTIKKCAHNWLAPRGMKTQMNAK